MLSIKKKVIYFGISLGFVLSLSICISYLIYALVYSPVGRNQETVYLLIRPESNIDDLHKQIHTKIWPKHPKMLRWLIHFSGLALELPSGRYAISPDASPWALVQTLIKQEQSPIQLNLSGIRTEQELTQRVSRYLMMKPNEFTAALYNPTRLKALELDSQSVRSLFFATSYRLPWDITAEALMDSIVNTHRVFWNRERQNKLQHLGISQTEATILASIVQSESAKPEEYPTIARLYLNRKQKGMMLQSCPTVKFALEDFSIRRILKSHLEVQSHYNTYKVTGLPPGPICLVREELVDSVLNAPPHSYIYMCAKPDFSGYHHFSKSYSSHQKYATAYQKALDRDMKN